MSPTSTRRKRYARRRATRMARVEHDLTDEQWAALVEVWAGCAYCRRTDRLLQRDCVLAISRGGRYTLTNVVPACDSCNASKCNLEVSTWIRRKRLDERAFLERHLAVSAELAARFSPGAVSSVPVNSAAGQGGDLDDLAVAEGASPLVGDDGA